MTHPTDQELAAHAVRLAVENATAGALPFAAIVVKDGQIVATGVNTALADNDPTAHAESAAVRAACRALQTLSLAGATLVASAEPCAMCQTTAHVTGIDRIIYAATRDDVPDLGSVPLPPRVVEMGAALRAAGVSRIEHVPVDDSGAPFDRWLSAMPAVKQLRLVVEADDYDAAVAFYRDVLGLTEEFSGEDDGGARVLALRAGRATLEIINPAQRRLIDQLEVGREVSRTVSHSIRVAFEVGDSSNATDIAVAAGAELLAPPTPTPWGSLNARLEAPGGLQITFFQELDGHDS